MNSKNDVPQDELSRFVFVCGMIAWVMKMLVSMTDLTKYNGEKCILDHIELHIEDKDKVGILGVNGTHY